MSDKVPFWKKYEGPERDSIEASMSKIKASFNKVGIDVDKIGKTERPRKERKPVDPVWFASALCVVGCIACLVTGLSFVGLGIRDQRAFNDVRASNLATIENLAGQLESLKGYTGKGEQLVHLDTIGAEAAGNYVVQIQNKYLASPPYAWVRTGKMTDVEWNAYYDDLYEIAKDAIKSDTGHVGAWYLPPEIYLADDGTTPFHWQFEKIYNYTDTYVPVVWTCWKDGCENLIAYATGEYRFEEDIISNIQVYTTSYGQALYNEINNMLLTYDINDSDGLITEEERQALIASMEADMQFQTPDVDTTVKNVLSALEGKTGEEDENNAGEEAD